MKSTILVLADAAAVTTDGKLIIHGVFDHLRTQNLPAVHPSMALVYQVQGAEPNRAYAIRVRDVMNEKTTFELALPPNIDSARGGKVGGIVQLNGMKFDSFGTYAVSLLSNGEIVATMTLTVSKA